MTASAVRVKAGGASRCGDGACSIENSGRIGTSSRACTRVSNASWGAGTLCTGSGYGEDASPECGHADRVFSPWPVHVVLAGLIDGFLVEFETDRVDAVAQIGRCRVSLTFENMAEVSTTGGAAHFGADLSQGSVLQQDDCVGVLWCVEAGPSAVRIELCRGAKQLRAAGTTSVGSGARGVGVFANEGWLGSCLAQHVVSPNIWRQGDRFASMVQLRSRSCANTQVSIRSARPHRWWRDRDERHAGYACGLAVGIRS